MVNKTFEEVPIEKLRWRCDPDALSFNTTESIHPCDEIIGQNRALEAIRLGLDIHSIGYNIFVTGLAGTGRFTTIKCVLQEVDVKGKIPNDLCYVNNFKNTDMPHMISLPAGQGNAFKKEMETLIETLKKKIPLMFENENYLNKKKEVVEKFRNKQAEMFREFEKKVNKDGFALVQIQMGPYSRPGIFPLVEGNPVNIDQLETMVEEDKFSREELGKIKEKQAGLINELEDIFKETRKAEKQIKEELTSLDNEVISPAIKDSISDIKEKFNYEKVQQYLDEVQEDILANPGRFREKEETPPPLPGLMMPQMVDSFSEYQVNVLVDNSETKGAPIIVETTPNYRNLFGTIERVVERTGIWKTDFLHIKAGSFLRANGGYLIFNALDALMETWVWPTLKRTLKNQVIEIQTYDPLYFFSTSALKPEPIECNTKVIMIGDTHIYYLLYSLDDDFKKIFKIKADFDSVMNKDDEKIQQYASFIRKICDEEKLKPFDKTGIAAVVEYGVRITGRQKKLSTRFHLIADLLKEANYWAEKDASDMVTEKHVDKANEKRVYRVNLIEEKIQEMIDDGTILIDSDGMVVGQVNGLSVYNLGDHMFGKPSRITVKTSMGKAGIINIEREAEMSGPTHNKGVYILAGYLRGKYAQDKPITMSASICFEQSYGGVDGDSASSTEIYALLSSLSGLPLRQDIAVTGSVNQKGEIQPIGGVNEKIEGFFDVCKVKGLTGKQGVMIPHLNIDDLMLRKEVVAAVKEGKFRIYSVQTIDQGIGILTGMEAGERQDEGRFQEGTVNDLVDKKLRELVTKIREFEGGEEGAKEEKKKKKGKPSCNG
ncbi:MAG: ATP-dependent protease [Deltaproteobacteria bacterium RBG_19FT_COMBO_46_12]|nr:MAG: ATP-dependent protease [Deltaproteobacteria bacterium RBG_19FT_COMBO_46_12]